MTLDKKLARLRKKAGLSQAEVSEELDVSRQAVTKWETGASRPSTENLQSLSKLYNVPLEYLLDEKESDIELSDWKETSTSEKTEDSKKKINKCGIISILAILIIFLILLTTIFLAKTEDQELSMEDIAGEEVEPDATPAIRIDW